MAAKQANTFTDITSGNNICTEEGCAASCEGYTATTGWDAVTGLGTPKYDHMLAYLKAQDAARAAASHQKERLIVSSGAALGSAAPAPAGVSPLGAIGVALGSAIVGVAVGATAMRAAEYRRRARRLAIEDGIEQPLKP